MSSNCVEMLKEKFGKDVSDTASVNRGMWREVVSFLKHDMGFTMLIDLCGVDYPERADRLEVVVHLYNMKERRRLRVKTSCPEGDPVVPSLCSVFRAANWFEREAFDLFGIRFEGHPNMKRLLCHRSFVGHALRKDFVKTSRGDIPIPDTLMDEISLPKG